MVESVIIYGYFCIYRFDKCKEMANTWCSRRGEVIEKWENDKRLRYALAYFLVCVKPTILSSDQFRLYFQQNYEICIIKNKK